MVFNSSLVVWAFLASRTPCVLVSKKSISYPNVARVGYTEVQVFIKGFKRLHDFVLNFCEPLTGKNKCLDRILMDPQSQPEAIHYWGKISFSSSIPKILRKLQRCKLGEAYKEISKLFCGHWSLIEYRQLPS
jgi:hypothetical protein